MRFSILMFVVLTSFPAYLSFGVEERTAAAVSSSTGYLKIEGEGLNKIQIQRTGEKSSSWLDLRETNVRQLPAATYQVKDVWLRSSDTAEISYSLDLPLNNNQESLSAGILPDSTVTLRLGGPLTEKLNVRIPLYRDDVELEYKGCENDQGLVFKPLSADSSFPSASSFKLSAPNWEVYDVTGTLVKKGQFEYG